MSAYVYPEDVAPFAARPETPCVACGRERGAHDFDEDEMELSCPQWFQTVSGVRFYPTAPIVDDVRIGDIAHSLAHLCRFAGHSRVHYSVAQHSVLVSQLVPRAIAREGLLHDGAEAYVTDLPRPLKHSPLLKGYRIVEARNESAIATRFALDTSPETHAAIKIADRIALATERRDVLADHGHDWASTERVTPDATKILPWTPQYAAQEFLVRFMELGGRP